jgi:hypothetical protein
MEESPFEDPEVILKQVADYALPGPQPPPDDPAVALLAIDDWQDEWVVIFGNDRPNKLFLSARLKKFIERTNYLARWCEKEGLDSSPLVEYAHDANSTYYGTHPTLPPTPDGLRVLLDRLKFKLQGVQPQSSGAEAQAKKKRQPIPLDEADILVRDYLQQHPNASTKEVAKGVGIAAGSLPKLASWQAEQTRRRAARRAKPKAERRLSKNMEHVIGKESDPAAMLEVEDAARQMILEETDDKGRADFHSMGKAKQAELIKLRVEQLREEAEQEKRHLKRNRQDDDSS